MGYGTSFFEISAQLVPVLFLAMVVEDKLQPDDDESGWERVARTWVLALLFMAEAICLAVAAGGIAPSRGSGNLVSVCMLFAGFLIVMPVMGRAITAGRSHRERLGHASAALAFIVGAIGLALVIGF